MAFVRLPKGTEETTVDGEKWITARLATIRHGVSAPKVSKWRRFGCPALDRRRLSTLRFRLAGRLCWFYLETEMAAIATARAADIEIIEDQDGRWLSRHAIIRRLGIANRTFGAWQKDGWPLPGGGLFSPRRRRQRVWGGDGRQQRYHRWFYLEDDVEDYECRLHDALSHSASHPNWLTESEGAREVGVAETTIRQWATRKYSKGRKLRRKRFPTRVAHGAMGAAWKYYRPDLERIATGCKRRLTETEKAEIVRLLNKGVSERETARIVGRSTSAVRKVRKAC